MSPPRPPPVPTITSDLVANPKELARVLDQFVRDVNAYAKAMNDEIDSAKARLTAGGL